jgi:hypothetical protein
VEHCRKQQSLDIAAPSRDLTLLNEFCCSVFPSRVQDACGPSDKERLRATAGQPTGLSDVCDVKVQDATAIVADDKKEVEHTESDRWHGEEVHRRDCFPMVAEKSKPASRRLRISRCFAHPTGNGSLGNSKSEQEKFTMNPGCSPGGIFGDHFEDQIANLLRDSRYARAWRQV